MSVILLLASTWMSPTQEVVSFGDAKYYSEGLMERVAVNRGYIKHPSEYKEWLRENKVDGALALMSCGDLGRNLTVQVEQEFYRVIAIDCAAEGHYDQRLEQGDVVEFGYNLAMELGIRAPIPVALWFQEIDWKKWRPM